MSTQVSQETSTLVERLRRMDRFITAEELSKLLAVSSVQIYRLARAGTLPSVRFASSVRFDPKVVAAWLQGGAR
jgi:excisionase family DNA binding protein